MAGVPAATVDKTGAVPEVPERVTTLGSPRHTGIVGEGDVVCAAVGVVERDPVGLCVAVALDDGVPVCEPVPLLVAELLAVNEMLDVDVPVCEPEAVEVFVPDDV